MSQDHNHLNHATWECKYHVVFTPKYRKKALSGQIRRHLGTVFHDLARRKECQIEEGHMLPDHVHMLISIPPKYSVAEVIGSDWLDSFKMALGQPPQPASQGETKPACEPGIADCAIEKIGRGHPRAAITERAAHGCAYERDPDFRRGHDRAPHPPVDRPRGRGVRRALQ